MEEKNIIPKYIPLGSIVELDGLNTYVMVTGYRSMNAAKEQVFDYLGCLYPIGLTSPKEALLFNHNQVVNVIFEGYKDSRSEKYHNLLIEADKDRSKPLVVDARDYSIK